MTRLSRSALIVSDSAPLRRYMTASLAGARLTCSEAVTGFQAMDMMSNRLFALYVIDLDMSVSDGVAIFAITLLGGHRDPSPTVIGCSVEPDAMLARAPWAGAKFSAVLTKPFQPTDIIAAAQAALGGRPGSLLS